MAIEIEEEQGGKRLEVRLTGKLTEKDYQRLIPVVERAIRQNGKVRMLVTMHDFHGWTVSALWEDGKFALHHFRDIERLALVGERKWQEGMATFCKPFTTATIRYFDHTEVDAARTWLLSEMKMAA